MGTGPSANVEQMVNITASDMAIKPVNTTRRLGMNKQMRKAIGLVVSLALIPAVTYMAAPSSAAENVTLTVWDPGLMGHLADGALDTKTSFIYKAWERWRATWGDRLELWSFTPLLKAL